ncbi:hypothetical protein V8B55DRAFT_1540413 [Mucor lusitanicus]|uniref:G-protein coupled receptors family 1 profile domain-containing protein n=2 Tax=Mucor circinelloides f. lusitanicus TaxID=29924 RepID=A0A168NBW2_MUCCL|nr:hypothetical protein FB192DRAFT_1387877 [Mucor lusitanicus]OAD06074.1 hypothetical protein MUCCIDRAFT_106631 [Mucor lusitanicus CBS 277.49]
MLSAQENAWCVYTALFLFFSIILTYRCRHNVLLIPFAIFGMLMSVGNICLLAAHYGETSVSVNWVSKSLVLSLLPAASVLVFLGIMEAQLIFIRHIATAIHNRDHWGSLYLREPEKRKPSSNKKHPARPWTYYTSLVSLALYTLLAVSSVILLAAATSVAQKKIGSAVCVTLMLLVVCFNTLVIMSYSKSTNHVRLIRRNRDDMLFLKVTPILFSVCMAGMTALSWIYCLHDDPMTISITLWIVLESFVVYLPLIAILIMCIYTGKIKKIGRQYRIETDQRSFNDQYSYKTVTDIESVTKKLSQEESNKLACPPPPAYQPVNKTSPLASYA